MSIVREMLHEHMKLLEGLLLFSVFKIHVGQLSEVLTFVHSPTRGFEDPARLRAACTYKFVGASPLERSAK